MPELPDVEVFKRYLDATALHKKVESASVRDQQILDGLSARKLQREVRGRLLEGSRRHGKHLFVEIPPGRWLIFHFGMTGFFIYTKQKETSEDPHNRLLLYLENDFCLAFNCRRKLGFVSLTADPEKFIADKDLGPDALALDFDEFHDRLRNSRGAIKSWLMNQQQLAGIGNVYSDEILFQARVHPKTPLSSFDDKTVKHLFRTMGRVLNTAIEKKADPGKMPRTYLTRHREKQETCPRCGTALKTVSVSGRSAYLCPRRATGRLWLMPRIADKISLAPQS